MVQRRKGKSYDEKSVVGSGLAANLKMVSSDIYNLVFGGSGTRKVNFI